MSTGSRLLAELLARPDVGPVVDALRRRDAATHAHGLRVARLAVILGHADGMPADQLRELAVAALLHDLGKLRVDPKVVSKPGPLDTAEREQMREHPAAAVDELKKLAAFPHSHRIAPLHHEQGGEESYPRSGRERRAPAGGRAADRRRTRPAWLERAGRILALADRYDALVSRRPYKGPVPEAEVRAFLRGAMPDVAGLLEHLPPVGDALQ